MADIVVRNRPTRPVAEEKEEPGVSKMLAKLAKNGDFDGEPRGIRTPDALIKSQGLLIPL